MLGSLVESYHSQSSERVGLDNDYVETRSQRSMPEKRLLLAILRRAIWDFALYRLPEDSHHKMHLDAAGWIFWDGEEHMTFLWICDVLELNPKQIREATVRLTRDEIKRICARIEAEV